MVFSGNEAGNAGGAIFVADASSSMEIASGAVFKSNSAKLGGAIYNKGNLGTLDGVTFEDNTAETNGGAILNSNGGTIASITNSIFKTTLPRTAAVLRFITRAVRLPKSAILF